MKKKTLAVAVGALVALAAPASSAIASTTLIGSGSVAAEPVLRPLFAKYQKVSKGKVHFLYTANGGNAGVADVQRARASSPARRVRRFQATRARPTSRCTWTGCAWT